MFKAELIRHLSLPVNNYTAITIGKFRVPLFKFEPMRRSKAVHAAA